MTVVPFNDLDVLDRVLTEHDGQIAGVIIEPMMMNAGIIPPLPGYLEGVRALTREHGVLLTFDEVKTGLTVGPAGVTGLSGVTPDIVCLAKALGGGLPCGAIGGTHEVMSAIADGRYDQVGTFNGNPLTMAAARATLTEVLTPAAYTRFDELGDQMMTGALAACAENGVPAYGHRFGAKGCLVFHPTPVRHYREFLADRHGALATAIGSSNTTAASSCRRGARASSGRCRCSTPAATLGVSSRTSSVSRRRSPRSTTGSRPAHITPTPERLAPWDRCETRCGAGSAFRPSRDHAPGPLVRGQ